MKKIILLALTTLMMVGCGIKYTKQELEQNMSTDGYILKEIDSCEYFLVHISSYMDGGCYLPVHKNNCRFCEKRDSIKREKQRMELKELVEQLKKK